MSVFKSSLLILTQNSSFWNVLQLSSATNYPHFQLRHNHLGNYKCLGPGIMLLSLLTYTDHYQIACVSITALWITDFIVLVAICWLSTNPLFISVNIQPDNSTWQFMQHSGSKQLRTKYGGPVRCWLVKPTEGLHECRVQLQNKHYHEYLKCYHNSLIISYYVNHVLALPLTSFQLLAALNLRHFRINHFYYSVSVIYYKVRR